MEDYPISTRRGIESRILAKAWKNDAFRERLVNDPRGALQEEFGVTLPEGMDVKVHQETGETLHLVIPDHPAKYERSVGDDELEGRTHLRADTGTGVCDSELPCGSPCGTGCSFITR